jgi:predicted Ser/Thr protein kinase
LNCPSCGTETSDGFACASCTTPYPATGATGTATPTPASAPGGAITLDLSPGRIFHNRYEIAGLLGRGGMGVVYRARDRALDEVVAIKFLRPDFAEDPRMAERFRSEIKLARKVRHRNVCAIHDYGEEQGLLFISMELIEGTDLKHVLRERGPLPSAEAFDAAIQIADGLSAVHDAGIIHRDLKTSNVVLDTKGTVRLMDFGIAKRHGGESKTLTATGDIVGTPEYMSPEQGQGHKIDFRSDVYALGIVVYELFTGRVPFKGDTPISTILKHIQESPSLTGPGAPDLPPALVPVLRRALAKQPAGRHPSAAAFAQDLREARAGRAPADPGSVAVPHRAASRRPVAPIAGVAMLAVATGVAWFLWPRAAPPAHPVAVVTPAATAPPATVAPPPPIESPTPASVATAPPRRVATPRATPVPRSTPPAPVATPPVTQATPVAQAPPPAEIGPGLLQVVARPWAEVAVDGRVIGETPLDVLTLPAGAHTVRFRHPAWLPVERTISVHSGQTERLSVDFNTQGTRKQ